MACSDEAAITNLYVTFVTIKIDAAVHDAALAHAKTTSALAKQTGPPNLGAHTYLSVQPSPYHSGGQSLQCTP